MTLAEYARPLRALPVDEIDTEAVLGVLQPLWRTTPETASRLRGRIETVLDAARAKGHIARNEANPARWRGHLDKLLPKRTKLTRSHHAAMGYRRGAGIHWEIRERQAVQLALEFLILTAARSGEVLGARWAEFDLEGKVWVIPAARMKASASTGCRYHGGRRSSPRNTGGDQNGRFVFAGRQRRANPRSGMARKWRCAGDGRDDARVPDSFRDWCGEATTFPSELAEAALAHVTGDATERAYRRGDALRSGARLWTHGRDFARRRRARM